MTEEQPVPHKQDDTQPLEDSYMSPREAAGYERRAKMIGIGIFLAVLFGGAILFDIGASSWSPQQRESIFVPKGTPAPAEMAQQDIPRRMYDDNNMPPQPEPPVARRANPRGYDNLILQNPRSGYDLPAQAPSPEGWLRMTTGVVKAHAPRRDRMNDGSTRKNLYARTEYYMPDVRSNCFFHQYMGLEPVYSIGQRVRIQYDPTADDACGTSRIVAE
ncbi:MAG TPA: hypothetical protein PLX33_04765 [Alphaproteobacteria bacterium]|nr:hypothetical protein [Alphaproteobacteria bacterium]